MNGTGRPIRGKMLLVASVVRDSGVGESCPSRCATAPGSALPTRCRARCSAASSAMNPLAARSLDRRVLAPFSERGLVID
jgi:hypothetical protein